MASRQRLLLVGAGRRIQNNYLPALNCLKDDFEICGIHSRTWERLQPVAERWNVPAVAKLADVDFSQIDAVAVSVPTAQNAPVMRQLLPHASRLKLVIDTPIAWTMAEKKQTEALFKEFAQVTVTEDYMNFPTFKLVREVVQKGLLGKVESLSLYNIGFLYHGLALIRSFTNFGPILSSWRQVLNSYSVVVGYELTDDFKATVIGPYRRHTVGGLVLEGSQGVISEFPVDSRLKKGKPVHILRPILESGKMVGYQIGDKKPLYQADFPEIRAMRAMEFEDKSDMNLLRGAGLADVFRSLVRRNFNRYYGPKNAFHDCFVSQNAERGKAVLDPFDTFGTAQTQRGIISKDFSWCSSRKTFIKTRTTDSSRLSASEKIEVSEGSILSARLESVEGDHLQISNVQLDGSALPLETYFIYKPAWQQQ